MNVGSGNHTSIGVENTFDPWLYTLDMDKDDSRTQQDNIGVPENDSSPQPNTKSLTSEAESSRETASHSSSAENQARDPRDGSSSTSEESVDSPSIEDMLLEAADPSEFTDGHGCKPRCRLASEHGEPVREAPTAT